MDHPNRWWMRTLGRDRASLVRAKDIDGSEVLDGVETFDDYFSARDADG
jgi:hypothetical protein